MISNSVHLNGNTNQRSVLLRSYFMASLLSDRWRSLFVVHGAYLVLWFYITVKIELLTEQSKSEQGS